MKYLSLASLLFLMTGCAFSRDYVTIDYPYEMCPKRIEEAENVPVNVVLTDTRESKEFVGCKKNGYGMECAYIVAENDVGEVLKKAITSELEARGFVIREGAATIDIEFCKFNNNFELGFFSSDSKAESIANVMVKDSSGALRFSKTVFGHGRVDNCLMMTGGNACKSLNGALGNTVQQLVNDPNFINSLSR